MKERCAAATRGVGAPADARPGSFLVVTDTAQAQICGVLRKFRELQRNLREMGCEVLTLAPDSFFSFSAPSCAARPRGSRYRGA